MKCRLASLMFLLLLLGGRSAGEEVAREAVMALLRRAADQYEIAAQSNYRVFLSCPEMEQVVAERLAFLPIPVSLQPKVELLSENGQQTLRPVLEGGAEEVQAMVEQLCRSSSRFGTLLGMAERCKAWPSFFRSIPDATPIDMIQADDNMIEFEISGLAEPFQNQIVRSCRVKLNRRTTLFEATTLDFGQSRSMEMLWKFRDVQPPSSTQKQPFLDRIDVRQTVFLGDKQQLPEKFALIFGEYRFLSAAETAARAAARAAAEAKLAKLRADLLDRGLSENRVVQIKYRREGTLDLDLRGLPLSDLSFLAGLPVRFLMVNTGTVAEVSALTNAPLVKLELSRVPVRDLHPLHGLPLTELFISYSGVSDLSPLVGMPLGKLDVNCTSVGDLTPLRGMPLRELKFNSTKVREISSLTGMRLTFLDMSFIAVSNLAPLSGQPLKLLRIVNSGVTNLAALAGAPLERLDISGCAISDLTPLRGMPLQELQAGSTDVCDLSPLAGMKLEYLRISDRDGRLTDLTVLRGMTSLKRANFSGASGLRDLHPLEGCVNLEELTLPPNATGIEFLRRLPKLKLLSYRNKSGYVPDLTAEAFWKQLDRDQQFRAELCRSGASPEEAQRAVLVANDGLQDLDLSQLTITNIQFLAGRPVRRLQLRNTKVTDIRPLRGAPLEYLSLTGSPVSDVSPLADCPKLRWLSLSATRVTDVRPVLGLKFTHLSVNAGLIKDVSPLAECVTLESIHLPDQATGVEALRRLPNLKRLSYKWDGVKREPSLSVDEFWRAHDAAQNKK